MQCAPKPLLTALNMFLFACVALLAAADEEKRVLLNDQDLIHSEITALRHQIQEMNVKLLDQHNKLVEQERFKREHNRVFLPLA